MPDKSKSRKTIISFQHAKLVKDIERLTGEATRGSYQAQMRCEAIQKLVDPALEFCDSDLRRILNKGHSKRIQKGLRFYRLMSQLTMLVEPIGEKTGPVCPVRLIPFEELTWEAFLDSRFPLTHFHLERAVKSKEHGQFNGEAVLSEEERKLYRRLKPYFGSRKKPTLQSLALNLLNEEGNGKGFSERALYTYRDAVREHRRKKEITTATRFSLRFYAVESFGLEKSQTVRQSLDDMRQSAARSVKYIADSLKGFAEHVIHPALLFNGKSPLLIQAEEASRSIARIFEGFHKNHNSALDFGQIAAKAIASDFFPRKKLYRNLQR